MTAPEAAELEAVDAALAGRYVHPEHAELAELALLLRDERPEPAPAWATQLDRRAQARFPARPRKKRDWGWMRPLVPALAVILLLSPIVLIARSRAAPTTARMVAARGRPPRSSTAPDRKARAAVAQVRRPAAARSRTGRRPKVRRARSRRRKAGDPSSDARDRRNVQRSAALTLAAPRSQLDRVAGQIGDVAADVGGFVDRSSITQLGAAATFACASRRASSTPRSRRSRGLGRVRDLSRNSVDITSNVVSARDRLTEARTERESLLRQLAQADTVNETESIRARLDIVAREIAAAEGSLRRVRNRANFANLRVELVPAGGVDEGAWTPGDAFDDGLRVLEVAAGVAVIAAAILLPLLAIWLLAWLAHRVVVRRRRERSLDLA